MKTSYTIEDLVYDNITSMLLRNRVKVDQSDITKYIDREIEDEIRGCDIGDVSYQSLCDAGYIVFFYVFQYVRNLPDNEKTGMIIDEEIPW